MSENTWFTKPSPEVKSICENMTVEEYLHYQKLTDRFSWRQGIFIGIFVIFYSVTSIVFNFNSTVLLTISFILVPALCVNIRVLYQEQKQYLCSTEWAKSQGYNPEDLKLFSFH